MALLGEFLTTLSTASGAKMDSDAMKAVLLHPELSKLTIPDDFISGVMGGLLTKEAALSDKELTDKFFGKLATNGDLLLKKLMTENGLDEATAKEVLAGNGVFTRYELLLNKVKDLQAKQFEGKLKSPSDKKELEDQIKELNKQILAEKENVNIEKTKIAKERDDFYQPILKQKEKNNFLSQFEFGFAPDGVPKDAINETAWNTLESKAKENGLSIGYDFEKGELSLKTSDGRDCFVNNTLVSPKGFASKVFSENKLLKVSGAPAPKPVPHSGQPIIIGSNNGNGDKSQFQSDMAEAKQAFAGQ